MLLGFLQVLQRRCDELSFSIKEKKFSEVTEPELLAHECFHLANLVGKISKVCEARDHGNPATTDYIKREVIPDLIIYSLQLANLYDVDLDSAYHDRVRFVVSKLDKCDSSIKAEFLLSLRRLLDESRAL